MLSTENQSFTTQQDLTQAIIDELEEAQAIEDIDGLTEDEPALEFNITSYGADFDVDGIVRRIDQGKITVPDFQRGYVWTQIEASRLIESILMGLPIPGIFLSKAEDNKFIVLDGQQRLMTLYYFIDFEGKKGTYASNTKMDKFALTGVHQEYLGKRFNDLTESQQNAISEHIIHATIVKQDAPSNDDTSIYYIFERLNNGGQRLYPQEIRTAIYGGNFIHLLRECNDLSSWRAIYGKRSTRQKDLEAILRCLAFADELKSYKKPLKDFLNKYQKRHAQIEESDASIIKSTFDQVCKVVLTISNRPFRFGSALNLAFLDSFMASAINQYQTVSNEELKNKYLAAISDQGFIELCKGATSDETNVRKRFEYFM